MRWLDQPNQTRKSLPTNQIPFALGKRRKGICIDWLFRKGRFACQLARIPVDSHTRYFGRAAPSETMNFLADRVSRLTSLDERMLLVIEAYLFVADPDKKRKQANMDELHGTVADEGLDVAVRSKAQDLLEMIRAVGGGTRMGVRMAAVAAKIDLAAMVRD